MRALAKSSWGAGILVAMAAVWPQVVCAQWSDLGLSGREVTRLRWGDGFVYAATHDGVYRKTAQTADSTWTLLGFSGQFVRDVLPISPETLMVARDVTMVGADTVALFRSTDAGVTWSPFQNGLGAGGFLSERIVNVLFSPPGAPGTILAGTLSGISKSTNGGLSWKKVRVGVAYVFLTSGISTLWGGGVSNAMTPVVRRSTDGGENWTTSFTASWDGVANAMAVDPSDDNVAYLGAGGYLYRTADNGVSWTFIPKPPGVSTAALAARAFPPLRLYAPGAGPPGSATFFRSDDGAASWTPVSLPAARTSGLTPILARSGPASDTLFFGSANGVLRYVETELVGVDASSSESRLQLRVSPNPATAMTVVTFSLPSAMHVSLRVLDPCGREVATLLSGQYDVGPHRFVWDHPGQPSGVYFLQLRTGSIVATRKTITMR